MKKIWSSALACVLGMALLAGCTSSPGPAKDPDGGSPQTAPVDVRTVALKGPTAMGMVRFMSQSDAGNLADNDYSFDIVASPDEVTTKLAKGEVDIAAIPANLSAVLYQKMNKGVEVLAINTLGILYLCEAGDSVHSVADLAGKTIYASGKGATPEYALDYLLSKAGLVPGKDVAIEWKSEHAECVAALASDDQAVAMLPQPFVTVAQAKNDKIRVAVDMTKEWDALTAEDHEKSTLVTGVVVARTDFIKDHPEAVDAFLRHYRDSVSFVNSQIPDAAKLIGDYGIIDAAVAQKAIPQCNIVYHDGDAMKEELSGYLAVLMAQNPQAVGGSLPEDDFYYRA